MLTSILLFGPHLSVGRSLDWLPCWGLKLSCALSGFCCRLDRGHWMELIIRNRPSSFRMFSLLLKELILYI